MDPYTWPSDPKAVSVEVLAKRPAAFRYHIDHMGNEDKDVWGIQQCGKYRTVHELVVYGVMTRSKFRGEKAPQPRAFLHGQGVVKIATLRRRGARRRCAYIFPN